MALADQLIAAVRARLENLLEGWSPEQYPDLVRLLNKFATEVIPTPTMAAVAPGDLKREPREAPDCQRLTRRAHAGVVPGR